VGILVCCVACDDSHIRASKHPVGAVPDVLRLAQYMSLLFLVWLAFEVVSWKISPWRRVAALAVGLLSLLLTLVAADLLLVGQ
jgi:hypothetical protein